MLQMSTTWRHPEPNEPNIHSHNVFL
jgi:hypothetical protein